MNESTIENVLSNVRATLRRHGMTAPGERVGVAVSGGADSVCLLHVLHQLSAELGISLSVLHLNHKLRGDESDADERFVAAAAGALGLPFVGEAAPGLVEGGGNLEQAGRDARRCFFERVRTSGAVDRVATAHTRSDQAETLLLRLMRGAGTAGLAGILPVTADGLIRPLIDCSRGEVESYLRAEGIDWREDRTNLDPVFMRNRIRRDLIPLIEREYSPAIAGILAATADVAREEEAYWKAEVEAVGARFLEKCPGAVIVDATVLAGLHPALARRLVRHAISLLKGNLRGIDLLHVEQVLDLAVHNAGHGRTQIPGVDVIRSYEWLRIGVPRQGPREARDYSFAVEGPFPVRLMLPDSRAICLELLDRNSGDARYNQEAGTIDWDTLPAPLELRNWRPGDHFEAPGRSSAKIKSWFQEGRVPLWERQGWPVLLSGGDVVWTRRFGVGARWAAKGTSQKVLRVYESAVDA